MRDNLSALILAIIALSASAAAPAQTANPPPHATIKISDSDYCVVEDTRIPCSNVLNHLRDVLKLPAGSRIHVLAEKSSTYDSTAKVFGLLQKSEYVVPFGYINVAE